MLENRAASLEIPLQHGDVAIRAQRPGPLRARVGVKAERTVEPVTALRKETAGHPQEPRDPGQMQPDPHLVGLGQAELQGRPQVCVFQQQPR